MRRILMIFSFTGLSFYAAAQPKAIRPSMIEWHSRFNIKKLAFSADGNHLLSLGDDRSVIISDLKKRLPLAKTNQGGDLMLAPHPTKALFYTAGKEKDSVSIHEHSLPGGEVKRTARIPLRLANGFSLQSPELIETDFNAGTVLLAYGSDAGRTIAVFSLDGVLLKQYHLQSHDLVNAIIPAGDKIWISTMAGVFETTDTSFRKIFSAQAGETIGNMLRKGNTLVILSDQQVTWYKPAENSKRSVSIRGFFGTGAMDVSAGLFRFHHPFAIDADLNAWLTDTRSFQLSRNAARVPYSIAKISLAGITYPFQTSDVDYREKIGVEPEVAVHPAAGIVAVLKEPREVMICDQQKGELFSFGRKNLPVKSVFYTATPGKVFVQTDDMNSPAFILNLSNGRMETIGVMDALYYEKRSLPAEARRQEATEELWWPSQHRYYSAAYWTFRNDPYLYFPFRDRQLPAPGGQQLELNKQGLLLLRGKDGKQVKSLQLSGLVNESWGMDVENGKLSTGQLKTIPFNDQHFLSGYQYDSAAALLVLFLQESGTSRERTVHVIDLKKFALLRSYASDRLYVLTNSRQVVTGHGIFSLDDHSLQVPFPEEIRHAEDFTVSKDGKYLYFYVNGNEAGDQFYRWDMAGKSLRLLGKQYGIDMITCDPHSSHVITKGLENQLMVWSDTGLVATVAFSGEKDFKELRQVDGSFLVLQPDGYYMGSNKYHQLLKLHNGERSSSIADVDVLYHRPDKVLQSLGYAPGSTIEPLKQQAEARALRNKLKLNAADLILAAPETIPYFSNGSVQVSAAIPAAAAFKTVRVYVNGTAVSSSALKAGSNSFDANVELVDGVNHIRLCLADAAGKETPGDYVFVNSNAAEASEIYLVGLGVSEYQDTKHNLKYAAKDMNDLLNYLSTTDTYSKVHATRFSNAQVTKAVVDSVRGILQRAKSRDVVICYFAGHGMLDRKNEYFLATYNMNFDEPSQEGIYIGLLNDAVAASPARKKMIFIDACNSGLLDDLGSATDSIAGNEEEQQGVVKRGLVIRKQQKASAIRYGFNHFSQGSGVDILAASAGNEYALELGSIRNGVFTYSLLKAMKSGEADFNHDNNLTLSELQQYVSDLTRRLTRGAQRPSFRQNNLYQDIRLLSAGDSYLARFMDAAKFNHVETLKLLLTNREVEVDQKNKEGFTALAYAAREGSLNAAKFLVENGADVNLKTDFGYSPLYLSAWNNHYRIAYLLMTRGASSSAGIMQWQMDSIRSKNNRDVLQVLEQFDVLKAQQDRHFDLAMHLVRGEIAKADSLMRKHNLDINGRLIIEGMPMVAAPVLGKNAAALNWVLDKGADVNRASLDDGYTALMFAANQGSAELVDILLARGASKTIRDSRGSTAADYARKAGFNELAERLK